MFVVKLSTLYHQDGVYPINQIIWCVF